MEEKNVALLGFIASATDYLKKHVGEDYKDFEDLKDVDLNSIRKELAKDIGSSFDRTAKNAGDLLNAGKDAFENFINDKPKIISEFDEIFKVDFRKTNKEKDERITNHLMKILQGISSEDDVVDEYARRIASNCVELDNAKPSVKPGEEEIDDIFDEILKNETLAYELEGEDVDIFNLTNRKEKDPLSDREIFDATDPENMPESEEDIIQKMIVEAAEPAPETEEEIMQQIIVEAAEDGIKKESESEEKFDNVFAYSEKPGEAVDDLFDEPIENTGTLEAINDEEFVRYEERKTNDYIARLMSDLNSSNITSKIEENRKKEEEENQIYSQIKEVYPYLTDGFVRRVYELKSSFDNDYEDGLNIIILQRLKFIDVDGLRKFVEVVIQHDYLVNVDEEKMIVDVFKGYENSRGLILSEIFGIANQGRLLTGDFEGYRILINEDDETEEGE